jgi:hypothetical protein
MSSFSLSFVDNCKSDAFRVFELPDEVYTELFTAGTYNISPRLSGEK